MTPFYFRSLWKTYDSGYFDMMDRCISSFDVCQSILIIREVIMYGRNVGTDGKAQGQSV